MRLLLTGSSGWLGRFLAPLLRAHGHRVTGLDVAPGADTQTLGSVADRALIDRVFGEHGIEAVIHAGALHKPDIARHPARAFVDTNVTGTLNLLEAAVAAGHDRFIFTSTTSLMITAEMRAGRGGGARRAAWLDEGFGPLTHPLEDVRTGDIRQRLRELEKAVRAVAAGVDDPLRNPLVVEVEDLLTEMKVFQEGRPSRALP